MTAPNIVNVTTITGLSTYVSNIISGITSIIFNNDASSNTVLKINTLLASNTTLTSANITVKIFNQAAGAGTSVSIGTSISIPSGSTLAIIGKDTPIYLEENESIGAIAEVSNSIDMIGSYELIS